MTRHHTKILAPLVGALLFASCSLPALTINIDLTVPTAPSKPMRTMVPFGQPDGAFIMPTPTPTPAAVGQPAGYYRALPDHPEYTDQ